MLLPVCEPLDVASSYVIAQLLMFLPHVGAICATREGKKNTQTTQNKVTVDSGDPEAERL